MASLSSWIEGARLRTLPVAFAPVILGTACAYHLDSFSWVRALLALSVALFLQIGVNFANDYSDGIRGTDNDRKGPARLTGGGLAAPKTVLTVAFTFFGLAALCGILLVLISHVWILILIGALAVVAAWFYTGGKHPYGYMSFGVSELMVFIFFGLTATLGTLYVQSYSLPANMWALAINVGLCSVCLLLANNLRDIPTDKAANKKTLAVRLGYHRTRVLYTFLLFFAICTTPSSLPLTNVPIMMLSLFILEIALFTAIMPLLRRAKGRDLIPLLRNTGLFTLFYALVCSAVLIWA